VCRAETISGLRDLSASSLCDVDVESGWPGHRRGFRSLGIRDGSIIRRWLAWRTCRTARVGSGRVLQPTHEPLDIDLDGREWVEVLVGAPAQEDPKLRLGVQPGLAALTARHADTDARKKS